jgi:hypothetical protein
MPAGGIGPVKRMLMSLHGEDFSKTLMSLLRNGDGHLRNALKDYAKTQRIVVS